MLADRKAPDQEGWMTYLGSQNVSTNAPNAGISFTIQPLMTKVLGVEIMYLETSMMHMFCLVLGKEQGMVIDGSAAAIDMHENTDVLPIAHAALMGSTVEVERDIKEV
jgi:hypothetical protein